MELRKPRAPAPRSIERSNHRLRVVALTLVVAGPMLTVGLAVIGARARGASSALPSLPTGALPGELAGNTHLARQRSAYCARRTLRDRDARAPAGRDCAPLSTSTSTSMSTVGKRRSFPQASASIRPRASSRPSIRTTRRVASNVESPDVRPFHARPVSFSRSSGRSLLRPAVPADIAPPARPEGEPSLVEQARHRRSAAGRARRARTRSS